MSNAKLLTLPTSASTLLASAVRATRCRLGLTRLDFATECGTSETTIARWERGDVEPKVSTILASDVLRVAFLAELNRKAAA